MDEVDPRLAEAVEHVQRAAREMISAMRNALDVVEDLTKDPAPLQSLITGVVSASRGFMADHGPSKPEPSPRVERIRVDAADFE